MAESRKYSEIYLKLGFTPMLDYANEKLRCVLSHAVLSNEAMKLSKLKRHLQQKHPEHVFACQAGKDLTFFQRQKCLWKEQKLDASGYFQQQSTASLEASFEVALQIAKQKKLHMIRETNVKPCAVKMVKVILS